MKITWQVDDGYVGQRTHTTVIPDDELAEQGKPGSLQYESFIMDFVEEDFRQRVSWTEVNRE